MGNSEINKREKEKMKINAMHTHIVYTRVNKRKPQSNKMQIMLVNFFSEKKYDFSQLSIGIEEKLIKIIKDESYGFNGQYKAIEGVEAKYTKLKLDYNVDWTLSKGVYNLDFDKYDFVEISEHAVHKFSGYNFVKSENKIHLETIIKEKDWKFIILDNGAIIYEGYPTSEDGKIELNTSNKRLKVIVENLAFK